SNIRPIRRIFEDGSSFGLGEARTTSTALMRARMGTQGSPVKSYDYLLKFLLVGDSDVGKGEILDSLQDGSAESPYAYSSVIGELDVSSVDLCRGRCAVMVTGFTLRLRERMRLPAFGTHEKPTLLRAVGAKGIDYKTTTILLDGRRVKLELCCLKIITKFPLCSFRLISHSPHDQGYPTSNCLLLIQRLTEGSVAHSSLVQVYDLLPDILRKLFGLANVGELQHPHTVPADGAVGVEVEGHQVFWTCDNRPFILVLTTVPPHTDSLGVSTKTKAGLVTEDDPLPF
ncbi:hypothetical protein NFI96_007156, partial [Prochilodus magdalenae]